MVLFSMPRETERKVQKILEVSQRRVPRETEVPVKPLLFVTFHPILHNKPLIFEQKLTDFYWIPVKPVQPIFSKNSDFSMKLTDFCWIHVILVFFKHFTAFC